MKNTLVFLMLFVFGIVQAQKENIKLPKITKEIKLPNDVISALFNVYLEKNGRVYVKDSLVSYKELGDLAFKFNIEHRSNLEVLVHAPLHIDKDTPYKYVDKLKRELHQSGVRYYYRSEDINDFTKGVYMHFYRPTFFERRQISDSNDIQLEPYEYVGYPSTKLVYCYLDNLYSKRFKKADSILSKMKYTTIKFLKNDSLSIGDKKIAHNKIEKIYNEIKDLDISFIEYQPRLPYKIYFKNLIVLREIIKKKKQNKNQKLFIMPITGELQKEFDKEDIKL